VLSGIGSVVAGDLYAPTLPAGMGAVEGGSPGSDDGSVTGLTTLPPLTLSRTAPESASPTRGGDSLDERDYAAAHPRPAPVAELTGYQWPLPHGRITLPFGPSGWGSRIVDGELFHDGLDLATFCGDRVVAAHGGVVLAASRRYDIKVGWIGDLRPYLDRLDAKSLWPTLPIVVVIDDGNGYRSIYAHLSKAAVKKGETVAAGDLIGYEGRTGRASGCHLHYGLFSPLETARFGIDPGVVERMKLPAWEIARVDPSLVLPARAIDRPKAGAAHGPVGIEKAPLAE